MELRLKSWKCPIQIIGVLVLSCVVGGGVWAKARFTPDRLREDAEAALRDKNPKAAAARLKWLYRLSLPTASDLMLEARIAIAEQELDRAIEALDKIPSTDPLSAQALLLSGQIERQQKRLRLAEGYFKRALEAEPKLLPARRELLYIYGIQSRRPEVDAEFRAIAKLTALNHHDLFTWAFTQFSPHRIDDAPYLKEFIAADPEDRQSRAALAEILASSGGSTEEIEQALEGLSEPDPEVLVARARIAITNGQLDEAAKLLEKGPSGHPQLERIRGKLAIQKRDYAQAVACFQKVQAVFPYDRTATLELGQALALAGDPAAEKVAERGKRLNEVYNLVNRIQSSEHENSPAELISIASAFERAGLKEQAYRWFELAVSRDPFDAEAQRGLRRTRDEP